MSKGYKEYKKEYYKCIENEQGIRYVVRNCENLKKDFKKKFEDEIFGE